MRDASHYAPAAPGIPASQGAAWAPALFWQAPVSFADSGRGIALAEPLPVTANHGRWVVECPDCAGAQLACATDHRFLCNYCGNTAVDGAWRRIAWPQDRNEIEEALAVRPQPNRNWSPAQTVADLLAENAAEMVS